MTAPRVAACLSGTQEKKLFDDSLREETECLVEVYKRKIDALEALKKSLLHQAFNGELAASEKLQERVA